MVDDLREDVEARKFVGFSKIKNKKSYKLNPFDFDESDHMRGQRGGIFSLWGAVSACMH